MLIEAVHHAITVRASSSFWPKTLGSWAAILAGVAASGAALIGLRNRNYIQEIHVLVNSQKTTLEGSLTDMTVKRDELIEAREALGSDNLSHMTASRDELVNERERAHDS